MKELGFCLFSLLLSVSLTCDLKKTKKELVKTDIRSATQYMTKSTKVLLLAQKCPNPISTKITLLSQLNFSSCTLVHAVKLFDKNIFDFIEKYN